MTEPFDDAIDERLRAILRAEADSVDPSPEALTQIRARTENNRFTAWFGTPWLRPALAVGAAALIAGSVLFGTPQLRDQVLPQSLTTAASEDGSADGNGGGHASDGIEPQEPGPEKSGASENDAPSAAPEEEEAEDGADTASTCTSPPTSTDPGAAAAAAEEGEAAEEDEGGAEDPVACSPTTGPTDSDGTPTDPDDDTGKDSPAPGDGNGNGDGGSGDDPGGSPSPGPDSGSDDNSNGDTSEQTD